MMIGHHPCVRLYLQDNDAFVENDMREGKEFALLVNLVQRAVYWTQGMAEIVIEK